MATKIVGLDLGSHTVKLCEIVTTMRKFELVGFGSEAVDTPPGQSADLEALASAAHRLLDRRGLMNESIMCSLPPGLASTIQLDMPFDQPKKIEAILPFQLEDAIPLDLDEVVYDYQIVDKHDDGSSRILCAYVRETDLVALLDALQAVKIDPKRISLGPLTFSNLYEHLVDDESDKSIAVLDMGHEHSELTIFEMGVPRVVRDISCGGRDTSAAIADALQVSHADAERAKKSDGVVVFGDESGLDDRQRLMNETCQGALNPLLTEVNRSMAAYEIETGNRIERLYCTGGASRLRGFPEYLGKSTRIATQELNPLQVHFNRLSADPESQGPLISKSLALSVQAFAQKHRNEVNLRKGEYGYTGDFGFLRGRIITVTLAVLLMIAMGAMMAVTKKRVLEAEHNRLKSEVATLSEEILGTENEDVSALLAMVSADRESDSRGIPEYSALRLLAEISDAVDPDIMVDVDRIELDVERKSMTIRGKTGTTSDVDNIVRTLRQNRCFRQTDVPRNEKSNMDGELKRRFRITGKLTCS